MGLAETTSLIFHEHIAIPEQVLNLLVPGEEPVVAFRAARDYACFTSHRLIIVVDRQGVTRRKVETYSIPYSAVHHWSTENAGTIDLDSELELHLTGQVIKILLGCGTDIHFIDRLIAARALGL